MCATTRGTHRLREFLLRNLLVGVSHIVLMDDNSPHVGFDIAPVVAPLVALGLVTVSVGLNLGNSRGAWDAGGTSSWDTVHAHARRCISEYGNASDWLMLLDTDEVLYAEVDGEHHHAMSRVVDALEAGGLDGILVPWTMMYGEQKTLEAQVEALGRQNLIF